MLKNTTWNCSFSNLAISVNCTNAMAGSCISIAKYNLGHTLPSCCREIWSYGGILWFFRKHCMSSVLAHFKWQYTSCLCCCCLPLIFFNQLFFFQGPLSKSVPAKWHLHSWTRRELQLHVCTCVIHSKRSEEMLKVLVFLPLRTLTLLVAEESYFNLTITLSNHGDDSYNTNLTMRYPESLSFSQMTLIQVAGDSTSLSPYTNTAGLWHQGNLGHSIFQKIFCTIQRLMWLWFNEFNLRTLAKVASEPYWILLKLKLKTLCRGQCLVQHILQRCRTLRGFLRAHTDSHSY